MLRIKKLHRSSALVLFLFIFAHFVNHLFALSGFQNHIHVMQLLRFVYRNPVIEIFLLLSALIQVITGLYLFWIRRHHRHRFVQIQRFSGLYLAFFLTQHVLAALYSRYSQNLDTNVYWASSVLIIWPYPLYYIPYYTIAPIAFLAHITIAVQPKLIRAWSRLSARRFALAVVVGGLLLSLIVIGALGGLFFPVQLPSEYIRSLGYQ